MSRINFTSYRRDVVHAGPEVYANPPPEYPVSDTKPVAAKTQNAFYRYAQSAKNWWWHARNDPNQRVYPEYTAGGFDKELGEELPSSIFYPNCPNFPTRPTLQFRNIPGIANPIDPWARDAAVPNNVFAVVGGRDTTEGLSSHMAFPMYSDRPPHGDSTGVISRRNHEYKNIPI